MLFSAGKTFTLIDALIRERLITPQHIKEAKIRQSDDRTPLTDVLIEMGIIGEEDLLMVSAKVFRLPVVLLSRHKIDPQAIKLLPRHAVEKYGVFPLHFEAGQLTLAIMNPDRQSLREIERITNCSIALVLSTISEIKRHIKEYYPA